MIAEEINADPQVKHQYDLISSVPGVGPVLASNLLALTDAFQGSRRRDNSPVTGAAPLKAHRVPAYAGEPTSRKANAGLKSLLHMALVAIRNDAELGTYYKRKVAEESPSCVRSTLSVARSSIASVPSCARSSVREKTLAFVIE
ncbi:MAG: transposase [Flavobacteriales bacterium]|nr:transposase [Flavobacteriales bacterium]